MLHTEKWSAFGTDLSPNMIIPTEDRSLYRSWWGAAGHFHGDMVLLVLSFRDRTILGPRYT